MLTFTSIVIRASCNTQKNHVTKTWFHNFLNMIRKVNAIPDDLEIFIVSGGILLTRGHVPTAHQSHDGRNLSFFSVQINFIWWYLSECPWRFLRIAWKKSVIVVSNIFEIVRNGIKPRIWHQADKWTLGVFRVLNHR